MVGTHRIDDSAAGGDVVSRALFGAEPRVDIAAPAIVDDVGLGFGVPARRHGPEDLCRIGDIDIVIHDDGESPHIGSGPGSGGDQPGHFGMPGMKLVHGNDIDESHSAAKRLPYPRHPRHARGLQRVPQRRHPAHGRLASREGGLGRRLADDDRIVAMVDRLHAQDGLLGTFFGGVIARPLGERAFGPGLLLGRWHEALEYQLRVGRNRQAR